MDFGFTEAEEAWRQEVREFCRKEVTRELLDSLRAHGANHSQPLYEKIAQRGWLGLSWPKEYGGQARSFQEQAIFNEEIRRGRVPPGTANVMRNSVHVLGGILLSDGTEEQKRTWLPEIAAGKLRNCQGLSEPGAGSDLASVDLRAVENGDFYVLNGTKLFSNAHNATHQFVVARTDPDVPKHKGISLFLAPLDDPGVSISPLITLGGLRRNEVGYDNVRVPRFNMVGEKNRGWYVLAKNMGLERSESAGPVELSLYLGQLIEYVKTHERDGVPLAQITAVRHSIAEIAAVIDTARLLCYRVVWVQSRGEDVGNKAAPTAKLYQSLVFERMANLALDVIGPAALLESWGEEREWVPFAGAFPVLYRDSRTYQLAGGTSEIQRNIIANRGLGMPR